MKKETASEKKSIGIFKALQKLVPVIIKAAPVLVGVTTFVSIMHGISWGIETMMQQKFFDAATLLVSGESPFSKVLMALLMLGGANVLCQVLNGIGNFLPDVMGQKITGALSLSIHKKMAKLSPVIFEDTDKLDDINKAEQGKNNAVWFVFIFVTIFTFYLPYFLFMGWYLFSLKPILATSIILAFIPTAVVQIIRTKVFAKLEDKSAPIRREYDYYESCMVSREYFKETRLLGGFSYFKKLYLDALDTLQKLRFQATMKTNLIELTMRMLGVAGYFGIMLMLFDALMKQEITVGAFAAIFNSIGMLFGIMEEVVCRHIGSMAQSMGSVQNYLNFLDLEERTGTIDEAPIWGDITLENVSFSYPKSEKQAVKNATFALKKGETLAIVGENGSGKSTLIRLISGLYLPSEGRVLMNGVETKDLTPKALFNDTSAVFQKYQRYQMTLEDNITVSDTEKDYDEAILDSISEKAGTDKNSTSFTDGYNTMLSREFDGVDLSGGEWQRVAIARGFFRDHDLIILDEPTAAIDPYEETRIYNRFAEISKDKSAIIVTHRLGSVKLADRIIVMKDGEVSQIGTHDELIALEGEYKRLYEAQEQWYKEDVVAS